MQNTRSDNMGVVSLTKSGFKSTLMWSHYADNHFGICLEYKVLDNDKVRKVSYEKKQPIINIKEAISGYQTEEEIQKKMFLTKSEPWGYEKEYRIISNTGGKLVPIDFLHLNKIYLGCRMDKRTGNYIRNELNNICIEQLCVDSNYELVIDENPKSLSCNKRI